MQLNEEWKPFGKYSVSSLGRIQNLKTKRILKQAITWRGYPRVCLRMADLSKRYFYVHRLVADVFIRPGKTGEQVNHKDCVKKNNNVMNLEYVTNQQNLEHGWANGKKCQGDTHGRRKLSSVEVGEIRRLASDGIPKRELAESYGVHKATIVDIVAGRAWKP